MSDQNQEWFDKQYPELLPKKHIPLKEQFQKEIDDMCSFIVAGAKPTLAELLNYDYGNNQTLLIKACIAKNLKLVKKSIKTGDNINHQDFFGNTALIYASKNKRLDIIKVLIENKPDFTIKNNEKNTFVDVMPDDFKAQVSQACPDASPFIDSSKFGL